METVAMLGAYIGTRVRVLPCDKYRGEYTNHEGVIERTYGDNIAVRLDGVNNDRLEHGLFWFENDALVYVDKNEILEETIMLENCRRAGIRFLTGANTNEEYHYALYDIAGVGDLVVVSTGHHGMALAQIVSIDDRTELIKCKREVVCVVNMAAYNERREKEQRMANLKNQMEQKAQQLQTLGLYEMLAQTDPTMRVLLDEYKSLMGM